MIDSAAAAEEIGISEESYKKLCSLFLETMKEDTAGLREALSTERRKDIRSLAHHIKGAAANLDFMTLSIKAEELQKAADDEDMELLRLKADLLLEEYKKIQISIEEIL